MALSEEGHGVTVAFGTSSFAANLLAIDGTSMSREALETTYQGTTSGKTFIPAQLYDPGESTFRFQFDQELTPPLLTTHGTSAETITVTFPDLGSGTATWISSGFMTSIDWGAVTEEVKEMTCNIKWTGTWAVATNA
ncbi:MAG: hypothetical protein GY832_22005 [Chloroflexi bacterium]|nr:hypothetical protein [Chloroflexota bacterium]